MCDKKRWSAVKCEWKACPNVRQTGSNVAQTIQRSKRETDGPSTPATHTMISRKRPVARPERALRMRRIAVVATIVALIPAALSYVSTMAQPSNSSWACARSSGCATTGPLGSCRGRGRVLLADAPRQGGARRSTRSQAVGVFRGAPSPRRRRLRAASYRAAHPPRAAGRGRRGAASDAERGGRAAGAGHHAAQPAGTTRACVAGLAWIDTKRTAITLNPGRWSRRSSSRGADGGAAARRARCWRRSTAASSSSDSHGGFALHGHTYAPMQDGEATFVGYATGAWTSVAWNGGPRRARRRCLRSPEPAADRRRRASRTRTSATARTGARRSATRSSCGVRRSASTATAT